MPHLRLEYSQSVALPADPADVFTRLHQVVLEVAGIPVSNCKSRAYRADVFAVGTGGVDAREASTGARGSGFVHLEIRLLSGRSTELKQRLSRESLSVLKSVFLKDPTSDGLQITVEICDIDRDSYAKHPPGTLSHP